MSMFIVIGIMFAGIAAGYLLREVELLQKIGKPISYTILLLLFLLGISVGANKEIVDNLATITCFSKKGAADERKLDRCWILCARLPVGMERLVA